jgi:hypothetical protein
MIDINTTFCKITLTTGDTLHAYEVFVTFFYITFSKKKITTPNGK